MKFRGYEIMRRGTGWYGLRPDQDDPGWTVFVYAPGRLRLLWGIHNDIQLQKTKPW